MSYAVKSKVSAWLAITERTRSVLALLPAEMEQIAQRAAAYERANHTYVNRTGNLERSTVGKAYRVGATDVTAELAMSMPYAGYVNRLGYSVIGEAWEHMTAELENHLQALPGRIASAY